MHTLGNHARLSKYQLIRPLGSGGMGVVYLAHDTALERDVAIKFVAPDRLEDAGAHRRLVREAQAAAALDHPCICPVYDVLTDDDGRTSIVMQYVEGETLADRLARATLDVRQTLALATDVAEALTVAHAHGVIHRDLKPQNIILTPSGRPKLLDFGIAKVRRGPDTSATGEGTHTDVTGVGLMIGTPAYMSPEQVLGQPIDARSDVFSLGSIVYECLTGQKAFRANTGLETCARVLDFEPPPVSSVRPGLTDGHDELCRRLLAKDPSARFQSAGEVLGALRLLQPGIVSSRTAAEMGGLSDRGRWRRRIVPFTLAAIAIAGSVALWRMGAGAALPTPSPDAERWYSLGTEHIREGAYYSAQLALREALRIFPDYAQAYARLAEALSELDEESEAQAMLIRASSYVSNPSRLPRDEGLRLTAVRSMVLRDLNAGATAYRALAGQTPTDPGGWLDLGRAEEAAGRRADARTSYQRAQQVRQDYAPAHLRLGSLAAHEARRAEALAHFEEAERLYRAASNREGETEALLERATFLNGIADLGAARSILERVRTLAAETGNRFQQVRAALLLSSITASEGRFEESRKIAEDAVTTALQNGLDTVAADGLIEVGTALYRSNDVDAAHRQLTRAIELANRRGAQRVAARAKLQLAGLFVTGGQPKDALNVAQGILGFLRDRHYRRYELVALSIMSRAYEDLGEYRRARDLAQQVLKGAEDLKDDSEVGLALETLAGQATATGQLPEALTFRQRLEALHRIQKDDAALAFDLTQRAELLVRLGRGTVAEAALREVEDGVARKVDAFVSRARRVMLVRALGETMNQRFAAAAALCERILAASDGGGRDSTVRLATVLLAHARARLGQRVTNADALVALDQAATASQRRELRYWRASTWLAGGRAQAALDEVRSGLPDLDRVPSDEIDWRLSAIGSAAARAVRDPHADELAARARAALERLRAAWKQDIGTYEQRPDLIERRRNLGVGQL